MFAIFFRMGAIQCGDIVVDPFCGGGSISVEVCTCVAVPLIVEY